MESNHPSGEPFFGVCHQCGQGVQGVGEACQVIITIIIIVIIIIIVGIDLKIYKCLNFLFRRWAICITHIVLFVVHAAEL